MLRRIYNFIKRPSKPLFKCEQSWFENYGASIGVDAKKIYRDYRHCCRWYGPRPYQYVAFDFYRLKRKARKHYACDVITNRICSAASKAAGKGELFTDKLKFNEAFRKYLARDYVSYVDSETDILNFINTHDEFMAKELGGHSGYGIRRLKTSEVNPKDFVLETMHDHLLLEEVIEQAPEMAYLNETSINTIRVVTVKDKTGKIHLAGASVRMGRKGGITDNVDNKERGGYIYPLDLQKGYISGRGINLYCTLYDTHPDYDRRLVGYQIPQWEEIKHLAVEAMDVVPEQRLVGWDICISKKGVCLIEGNLHPGSITYEPGTSGRKKELSLAIE